ncbi:signal recognition particle, SRP9/SRP14 subunit [Suhomyces tanzawaensis NRRL Y-17324]|uniref:Signal recognition particle subunit SRP14 n=1 Tax=Suhomyces tanzawaensis NRRL Y-17324 TaxID=984487 RepID=A0A1E4SFI0_9ASCO|nr:signal recognition particle, SRP9/SRP14 subunit [Suhomyces tanzawaensis NRRL Y-17324]ODV78152.1 signal recognition particle, SRP9/SRP14 subunit [Suhomyces tanzawaensis NRRL Y-17324]
MTRLDNSEFLKQVAQILSTNDGKSSVYLTQKRLSASLPLEDTTGINDLSSNVIANDSHPQNTEQYPVLIRIAMNGKDRKDKKDKTKLSTVVDNDRLDKFWTDYVQVIKNGFVGLKKKEKKKAKKGKVSK